MKKILSGFMILAMGITLFSCGKKDTTATDINDGQWRGTITVSGDHAMPFLFDVSHQEGKVLIHIKNGDEKLLLDEVKIVNDSIYAPILAFDAQIVAKIEGDQLNGYYERIGRYQLPFKAENNVTSRFAESLEQPTIDMNGKWATEFVRAEGRKSQAIGVFTQEGNHLEGTFLTPTGDYRFLEGYVSGSKFKLSTFDGIHLYLFEGEVSNDSIVNANLWSGKGGHYPFSSVKDENAELPDPTSLTYMKEGYENVDFTFKNVDGKEVSLSDEKYKDKVVLVQILGSWCPNCMDETRFLAPFYDKHKEQGFEVVGLCFEAPETYEKAQPKIARMKKKFGVNYELLYAGTPKNAEQALPMLNKVMSFPTTILIDKKGTVRQIHTGFSGPGTGKYYDDYVREFEEITEKLLAEEI